MATTKAPKSDHLWGSSKGTWHALNRHDPAYVEEEKISERLTALAAETSDVSAGEVEPVTYRVVVDEKPGTGRTVCGIQRLALDGLGVDPEKGDALCPACCAILQEAASS